MKKLIFIGLLAFGFVGHSERAACSDCYKFGTSCDTNYDCMQWGCQNLTCAKSDTFNPGVCIVK